MKNLLFILVTASAMMPGITYADIKLNFKTGSIFSLPNNINQREYSAYFLECVDILLAMYPPKPIAQSVKNYGVLVGPINQLNKDAIIQHLRKKNSPAANRLIQDIKKGVTAESLLDY
jgi:hypothetical protein